MQIFGWFAKIFLFLWKHLTVCDDDFFLKATGRKGSRLVGLPKFLESFFVNTSEFVILFFHSAL